MRLRFMRFTAAWTCHILIPLTLAAVAFYVVALITENLITSSVWAGLAGLAAFFAASRYPLIAIQAAKDILKWIAAQTQTASATSDRRVPWAGMIIRPICWRPILESST